MSRIGGRLVNVSAGQAGEGLASSSASFGRDQPASVAAGVGAKLGEEVLFIRLPMCARARGREREKERVCVCVCVRVRVQVLV